MSADWKNIIAMDLIWIVNFLLIAVMVIRFRQDVKDYRTHVDRIENSVLTYDFTADDENPLAVRRKDSVLYCRDDEDVDVLRIGRRIWYGNGCDRVFKGLLHHQSGGDIYVVVDKRCRKDRVKMLLDALCSLSPQVYFVGGSPGSWLCERWKGEWSQMTYHGRKVDSSLTHSAFYGEAGSVFPLVKFAADFANGTLPRQCYVLYQSVD